MQLRHFRYFLAVAEHGSFVAAARVLHVAQPSLSKQIAEMERQIGCPLFSRGPRGVRLTEAGRAFLEEAHRTVDSASRAVAEARKAQAGEERRLRLASGRLAHYPRELIRLLARFRAEHPDIDMQIQRLTEPQQARALRDHTVDVTAGWATRVPGRGFAGMSLVDDPMDGVLLPASHPLARQRVVSLTQLEDLTRLHMPRREMPELYRSLKAALLERGLNAGSSRAISMDLTSVTLQLAGGNCYVVMGAGLAREFCNLSDTVTFRPFREQPIPFHLALNWRRGARSPQLELLIGMAEQLRGASMAARP